MKRDLHDSRASYELGQLHIETVAQSPFEQFERWYNEALEDSEIKEANAMTLATVDALGMPRSRVVLLKAFDDVGFVFYTNYTSEKGKAIAQNPKVSLSFFWPSLERQVIIQGVAKKLDEEASTAYFLSRPKSSQLGALVSQQSAVIKSREVLKCQMDALMEKYKNEPIQKPSHWGGYKVIPTCFEYWQGRPSRLHDRIRYVKNNGDKNSWLKQILAP